MVSYEPSEINAFWKGLFDSFYHRIEEVDYYYPEKRSLTFTWQELELSNIELADYVTDHAYECIPLGETLLRKEYFHQSAVDSDVDPVCIRITELPRDKKIPINKLRYNFNGHLISVSGMVRKLSAVSTYMSAACFRCQACNHVWVVQQDTIYVSKPNVCPNECCKGSYGSIRIDRQLSQYRDYQDGEIQESPEGLTGGKQPQSVRFVMRGDITSKLTVGAKVVLNGILRMEDKKDSDEYSVTSFVVEVNSIEAEDEDMDEIHLTEEDEERVRELSQSPTILQDIASSIAPSIYGFDSVKLAMALQLVGGTQVHAGDGTTKRGDIHILLIGDPGTAKSQMLRSAYEIASRSIITSGKSASAAGLTATAARQTDGRWTVEAGALVLADGGLACVDELDKMRDDDRAALHSAMEDQKIYFAKAGMTMTLRTKCSLLAAANPKYGRFDEDQPFTDQIELPPSLISRFDLIFVITDIPDPDKDEAICNHILNNHTIGQIKEAEGYKGKMDLERVSQSLVGIDPKIPLEDLRHYIAYARKLKPVLTKEADQILKDSFKKIRGTYSKSEKVLGITFRQMDGYIRLATASAKLHLRDDVLAEDAEVAVSIIEQYLDSIANQSGISDIDVIETSLAKKDRIVMAAVKDYYAETGLSEISLDELMSALTAQGYSDRQVKSAVKKLEKVHEIFRPNKDVESYVLRRSV